MKKKKGFTLIELLAVIVVLAIIALIATPIVMNTIKNAKKGAAERSGESYVKQLETTMMEYRMESGNTLPDGEYKITRDENLCKDKSTTCSDEDKITIEMSGTKPSKGTITIENGQVSTTGTSMEIGDYTVSYDSTKKTYVATEKGENNVEVLCTAVTELSTQSVKINDEMVLQQTGVLASPENPYAYGAEYTCNVGDGEEKTFYVLEDGDTTTLTEGRIASAGEVSLIMNKNVGIDGKGTINGNSVVWVSKEDYIAAGWSEEDWSIVGNNNKGPITANNYLKSSTTSWSKLDSSQISLPSVYQIAAAGEITFDSNNSNPSYFPGGLPTWLYENLTYGYWTSTPYAFNSFFAWFVGTGGYLVTGGFTTSSVVRPVITISKTQLG